MKKVSLIFLWLTVALAIPVAGVSAQVKGGRGANKPPKPPKIEKIEAKGRPDKDHPQAPQSKVNQPQVDRQTRNKQLNPQQLKKQELQRRLMQAVGLTPEQRFRMQEIRRSHEDEVIAAGRRVRQARQTLDRAIMSEPYNEAEVNKAIESLAAAQADKARIDARVRAQVRAVLTPDQIRRFNQLQREMRREMLEQQNNQENETGSKPPNQDVPQQIDLLLLLAFGGPS